MEAVAKLKNVPTSPRKMRLIADLIRGHKVNYALNILKYQPNHGATKLEKLLLSAISNWQNKYEDQKIEEADLFIKEIFVDNGRMLKRVRPAPQGRAYRIRKRSNHVTLIVASREVVVEEPQEEIKKTRKAKPEKTESAAKKKTAKSKKTAKKTVKSKKTQKTKVKK